MNIAQNSPATWVISLANSPQSVSKVSGERLAPVAAQLLQAASSPIQMWKELLLHPQLNAQMFSALQDNPELFRRGINYCHRDPQLQATLDSFGAQIVPEKMQQAYPTGKEASELAVVAPSVFKRFGHFWPVSEVAQGLTEKSLPAAALLPLLGSLDLRSISRPELIALGEKVFLPKGGLPSIAQEILGHENDHKHEVEHGGLVKLLSALWEHRGDLKHHKPLMSSLNGLSTALSKHKSPYAAVYHDVSNLFHHP